MDLKQLRAMANQIARNFAIQGDEAAIAATAEHLRLFWDPRMKAAIVADDLSTLSPTARAAVGLI
jgi:formate dehydrogenase subunit delta